MKDEDIPKCRCTLLHFERHLHPPLKQWDSGNNPNIPMICALLDGKRLPEAHAVVAMKQHIAWGEFLESTPEVGS